MEDSHTHILSLPDDANAAFFGVYDGHGGNYLENLYTVEISFCVTIYYTKIKRMLVIFLYIV